LATKLSAIVRVQTSYRAAVLNEPRHIDLVEQPTRRPLAGEVLLDVVCAGVCGTDIAIYGGDYPVPLPLVLGHEFAARVAEAPARSPAARLVGELVTCEINNSCIAYGRRSRCEACRRGMPMHCQRRSVVGIIDHQGAFAERLVVPAGNLHRIPKGMAPEAAVFIEPLGAAMRTFELTPLRAGDTVLVLGCGRLGRLVALVAHKAGARVVAVSRSPGHLALVAPFSWRQIRLVGPKGAEEAVAAEGTATVLKTGLKAPPRSGYSASKRVSPLVRTRDELRGAILDLTRGMGADIVVEATGVNENLALAQRLVRPLGTVAMKSTSGLPVRGFDATLATVDEIRFQCSRCGPFDKAIRFMQRHGVPNASWISARFPLERTGEAIEAAIREPKVLIEVTGGG
jgi:threonine dehydrogenase-like Zn-dependent dehydrogenase